MSLGDFVFKYISDFWLGVKEKGALALYWDASIRQTANMYLQAFNVDRSKGLFTVPPLYRNEWFTFRFDDTTRTSVPQGSPTGFSHAFKIDDMIVFVEIMTSNVDPTGEISDPGLILIQDTDYIILFDESVILFVEEPPQYMYSNSVFKDWQVVYNNFGVLAEYPNPFLYSTDLYLAQVQGLWTALWIGATLANIELGLHILFGFPFMSPGKVESVQVNTDGSWTVYVSDTFGDNRPLIVPQLIGPPIVTDGQIVTRFTPLGRGITVTDYIDDLDYMLQLVTDGALHSTQIFFTFAAVLGEDALKAAYDIFGEGFRATTIPLVDNFLNKIKPEYVDHKLAVDKDPLVETMEIEDGDLDIFIFRRITSTVLENYSNVLGETPPFNLDDEVVALRDALEIAVIDGTYEEIYNV